MQGLQLMRKLHLSTMKHLKFAIYKVLVYDFAYEFTMTELLAHGNSCFLLFICFNTLLHGSQYLIILLFVYILSKY